MGMKRAELDVNTRMERFRLGLPGSVGVNFNAYQIFVTGDVLSYPIFWWILCDETLIPVMACGVVCHQPWQLSIHGVSWRPSLVYWIAGRARCRVLRPVHSP